MKKIKTHLFVLLSLFVLVSCSQNPNKKEEQTYFIDAKKEVLVQSEENDAKVVELANTISETLYKGDTDGYMSKFDVDYFMKKVTANLKKGKGFIEGFTIGAKKQIDVLPKKFVEDINNGAMYDFVNYKYSKKDKAYYILFRYYSEETGFNYHKYRVSKKGNFFFFNDMYIYLTGEYLSQTMGRISILASGESAFQQLLDGSNKKDLENFLKVQELITQQEFEEAHQVLSLFEGKMKDEKFTYIIKTQVAGQLNEELYKRELKNLFEAFPNDKTVLLHKVDYYLLDEKYDETIGVLNEIQNDTEDDFLEYLKGNVNYTRNDFHKAAENFKYISENYEDFFSGHSSYIDCLINTENYEETVLVLDRLIELEYDPTGVVNYIEEEGQDGEPVYKAFVNSKVYKKWKKGVLS